MWNIAIKHEYRWRNHLKISDNLIFITSFAFPLNAAGFCCICVPNPTSIQPIFTPKPQRNIATPCVCDSFPLINQSWPSHPLSLILSIFLWLISSSPPPLFLILVSTHSLYFPCLSPSSLSLFRSSTLSILPLARLRRQTAGNGVQLFIRCMFVCLDACRAVHYECWCWELRDGLARLAMMLSDCLFGHIWCRVGEMISR